MKTMEESKKIKLNLSTLLHYRYKGLNVHIDNKLKQINTVLQEHELKLIELFKTPGDTEIFLLTESNILPVLEEKKKLENFKKELNEIIAIISDNIYEKIIERLVCYHRNIGNEIELNNKKVYICNDCGATSGISHLYSKLYSDFCSLVMKYYPELEMFTKPFLLQDVSDLIKE
jgi:hypothetical protein